MKSLVLPLLKKYYKQLISIMLVSALGCSIMTGLSSACVSLERSLNDYLIKDRYPDAYLTIKVSNKDELQKIRDLESVEKVDSRLAGDTILISKDGRYLSIRVFTYRNDEAQKFEYWEEADPGDLDAVYIEYNFAKANDIHAGDTISFRVGDEYRKYFVSAIISRPETISVQVSDSSMGANSDFGYAFVSEELLKKEKPLHADDIKAELDGKAEELSEKKNEALTALNEAQAKLTDAKVVLYTKEAQYNTMAMPAQALRKTLVDTRKEIVDSREDIVREYNQILSYRKEFDQLIEQLRNSIDLLRKAKDGLKQIDEALAKIEAQRGLINERTERIMNFLRNLPEVDLQVLFDSASAIRQFIDMAMEHGYSYDVSEPFSRVAERLYAYMDDLKADQEYFESAEVSDLIIRILNEEEGIEETAEYKRFAQVISRYESVSPDTIFDDYQQAYQAVCDMNDFVVTYDLYNRIAFLNNFASSTAFSELMGKIADSYALIDIISEMTGQTIITTHDLVNVYDTFAKQIDEILDQLLAQRQQIIDALSQQGISEENLDQYIDEVERNLNETLNELSEIEEMIFQFDDAESEIDEMLKEIDESIAIIDKELKDAKGDLNAEKNEIARNEKDLIEQSRETRKEFADLENELAAAYASLEEGQGYEKLCNQVMVYFKDGSDKEAELARVEKLLGSDVVKSSYTYEGSGVKRNIDINLQPLKTLSYFMPAVFFALTLIASFLLMSLIISKNRKEIGILRALGFEKTEVRKLFCGINLLLSLAAIVLGFIIGLLLSLAIGKVYADFFPIRDYKYRINIGMYLLSAILMIITGQLSALISVDSIAKLEPSEVLSDAAADSYDLPEWLRKLSDNFPASVKAAFESIFRNQDRFICSLICVTAAVMMIFSSLAFRTSKNRILKQLYDQRIRYDCQVFFNEPIDNEYFRKFRNLDYVEDARMVDIYGVEVLYGVNSAKATINALESDNELIGIFDSRNRQISLPIKGIVLEKHLCEQLGAKKGDTVYIDNNTFEIVDISEQSLNRSQYLSFVEADKLSSDKNSSIVLNIAEEDEQKLLAHLSEDDNYLYSVFTKAAYDDNAKVFKTYDTAAFVITGFAIVCALIIILNTAMAEVTEKEEELAAQRTSDPGLIRSLLCSAMSCLIGLPAGALLARIALKQLTTAGREYVYANGFKECIITILLIFVFTVSAHYVIPMVLKKGEPAKADKDEEEKK